MSTNFVQIDVSKSKLDVKKEDLIEIRLKNNDIIKVNYSKLVSQSKYVRDKYKYLEALFMMQKEIDQISEQMKVDSECIKFFFHLIQQEKINIPIEKYSYIYTLSEYFNIPVFINELDNINQQYLFNDLNFTIQCYKDCKLIDSDNNGIQMTTKIETFLSTQINECFTNPNFDELPITTISRIIEKSERKIIDQNLLIDFILKSVKTHFILFRFVELQNLRDDKFDEFLSFIDSQQENQIGMYLQYLPFSLPFFKKMKDKYKSINNELNQINEEHKQTKNKLELSEKELEQTKNKLELSEKELEQTKIKLELSEKELEQTKIKLELSEKELEQTKNKLELSEKELVETKEKLQKTEEENIESNSKFIMPSFKEFHMNYLIPPMPVTEQIDFNEIKKYERESQLNNPSAQTKLALIFYIGSDKIKKDIKKAIELFEKAASLKYINAEICLGIIYYCGMGTDVNIDKAATLLDKAAEKGDSNAQLILGLIYLKQGNKKGINLIRNAAEQGNYFAQFDLGICYSKGEFIDIDFEKVIEWYQRSAQNGCADAMYNLGIIYQTGIREDDDEIEVEYDDNDDIFYLVEKNITISFTTIIIFFTFFFIIFFCFIVIIFSLFIFFIFTIIFILFIIFYIFTFFIFIFSLHFSFSLSSSSIFSTS